jgi:hypothetical protein
MPHTKLDLITRGLRNLGVVGVGDAPQAEDYAEADTVATAMFAQLVADPHLIGVTWTLETIPEGVFLPLAHMLSAELSATYTKPAAMSYSQAYLKFMAAVKPNDLTSSIDTNADGTISTDEQAVSDRAAYY